MEEYSKNQVQISLVTMEKWYALPDTPLTIDSKVTTKELNILVNTLLQENSVRRNVDFDFIVHGECLRSRLCDHLKEKNISLEELIWIEYVKRFPPPDPEDCLLHDDWVSAVKTCGKWILTGCYDNSLNIWTNKGNHVLTITGHKSPIKAVSWLRFDQTSATFISCSQDRTAMIWKWNIEKNSAVCTFICKGHERSVDCLDVNIDKSLLATGSWDTLLKIWSTTVDQIESDGFAKITNSKIGKIKTPTVTLQGHRECISSVQWIDKSTIVTSSWDHTLKLWDLNFGGIKSEITSNKSFFDASYSMLNGMLITASADKHLKLYDARSNQGVVIKNTYFGHHQWISSVTWSSNEEWLFLSGSYDNKVKLWDCRSSKTPVYDMKGHEDKVLDVDWSDPNFFVSGGADNTISWYDDYNLHEMILGNDFTRPLKTHKNAIVVDQNLIEK